MRSNINSKKTLIEIGQVFKDSEEDSVRLNSTVNLYKDLMIELLSLDLDHEKNRRNLFSGNGTAIGPTWAAMCLDDTVRTKRFIKGIFEAIEELQIKLGKSRPIHILYAGTGPYATLILPVLASFSEREIQVTLIEVNPESYDHVLQIFKILGFEGHLKQALQVDASNYQFSQKKDVDMVLSETMQRALDCEPQVSIFLNLQNQFGNDVIYIPQQVILSFGLSRPSPDFESKGLFKYESLTPVFSLNRDTKEEFLKGRYSIDDENMFMKINKSLTGYDIKKNDVPVILTEIQIYKNIWIRFDESGLTVPKIIGIDALELKGRTISFQYEVSDFPRLNYQL